MENVGKCRFVLQVLLLCLAMVCNALATQQTRQDASTLAEKAWRILERAMNTGNPGEQEAAVLALSEVPGQHAKLLLRSAARSSSPQKRAAAIRTLGAFGELPDLPLIGTALTDSDSWVRMTAADALSHFQNQATSTPREQSSSPSTLTMRVIFPKIWLLQKKNSCGATSIGQGNGSSRPVLPKRIHS